MAWQKALIDAYDACKKHIDYEHNDGNGLCPIAHQPLNVQIDVFIDDSSNFIRAEKIESVTDEKGTKRSVKIFVPADQDGSSRTSGKLSPKGLTDKLCYVCGDFAECFPEDKQAEKAEEAHQNYMSQMKRWINYGAPDEISTVYNYLRRNTIMKDILKCTDKVKTTDAVRFTVIHKDENIVKGTWQNREIAESFINFCMSTAENVGFDAVTGENRMLATVFPAQVRNSGDNAKIVSSNDKKNYTYRGGYINCPADCITIGYEAAQKMTNALRYLIKKQGISNGHERIVCFGSSTGQMLPNMWDAFFGSEEDEAEDTALLYAERVRKAVNGYRQELERNEKITVIGVDSADDSKNDFKGRLAVTRYYELNQNSFFDPIVRWYETCKWKRGKHIFTPAPYKIACAAYGIGDKLEVKDTKLKRVKNAVMDCTLEGRKLSNQVVSDVMQSVKNPQKYDEKVWRYNIVEVALAVLSRSEYDRKGEILEMDLNKAKRDRSYQFGRLLAVMERIEDSASYRKEASHKTTNAVKSWKAFTLKPAYTFSRLHQKVMPYMTSLPSGTQNAYKNTISEIIEKIESVDGFTNEKLDDLYLAGYYLQRDEMIKEAVKAKAAKENKENKEEKKEEEK